LSLPNNVPASFVIPIQATATERFSVVKAGLNYRVQLVEHSARRTMITVFGTTDASGASGTSTDV
jgi:hypothetical protein